MSGNDYYPLMPKDYSSMSTPKGMCPLCWHKWARALEAGKCRCEEGKGKKKSEMEDEDEDEGEED